MRHNGCRISRSCLKSIDDVFGREVEKQLIDLERFMQDRQQSLKDVAMFLDMAERL